MKAQDVRRLASAMLPVLLVGCTAAPMAPGTAAAQSSLATDGPEIGSTVFGDAPAGTSDTSQLMFELMIAELAGRRGDLAIALQGYLSASARTDDPRVADRAARLAIFARDWPAAQAAIERWTALAPDDVEALELHAQVLMRQGRSEEAAEQFAALAAADDDPDAALARIGALLQADPDEAAAMDVATRLAEAHPDSAAAQLALARLSLAIGNVAGATAALDRALSIAPDEPDVVLMAARLKAIDGDFDAALKQLSRSMERNPDAIVLRLGRAQLLVESGQLEQASAALADVGERADGDADLLLSVGLLTLEIDRPAEAARWFTDLMRTGEHTDQANFQLARINDLGGDAATAIPLYDAVSGGELYLASQLRVAELLAADGALDQARQRVQALRAAITDPAVQQRLVTTESRLLQMAGQPDAALDVLSKGLETYPDSSDLLYARALAAEGAGKPEMLQADLGRLIAAEPGNAHALNALGYHYAERNERLDEADGYLQKAMALRPDDPAIMDSLGWLRFRQGDDEAAVQLLRKALELMPDPEIAAHLGEVLWNSGRRDDARAVWELALESAPADQTLNDTVERLTR